MRTFSKKYLTENIKKVDTKPNYYLDFHKENSLNHAAMSITNLLAESTRDDNYSLPEPIMKVEKKFFADNYIKQVMAMVINKNLIHNENLMEEAKTKALQYLNVKGFNVGGYSDSKGFLPVRKNLVKWIEERDEGYKIDVDDIYLTNGGMNAYDHVISTICDIGDVVIVPNPCYPFYTSYNQACGVENLFYSYEGIEEGNPSKINYKNLTEEITKARKKGMNIKAMLVANPNNPLGTVMSEEEMEELIKFCEKNSLPLIAIETLQNSVYPQVIDGKVKPIHSAQSRQIEEYLSVKDLEGKQFKTNEEKKFRSFRYMLQKTKSPLELFSIFSISKGPFYSRGIRAGWLDVLNIDADVEKQLYKYKSIDLCSGVPGQIYVDLALNKPKEFGYEFLYNYEQSLNDYYNDLHQAKTKIFEELKKDNEIIARDIQAGTSFFVKSKNSQKTLKVNNVLIKSTPGSYYGNGLENYINFHIDSTLF